MVLRNLEHDGDEFFDGKDNILPNRQFVKELKVEAEKQSKEEKEKELIKKQKEWLNINNPALWE